MTTNPTRRTDRQPWLVSLAVVLASLVLGGLTSLGQTLLPAGLNSLSNSASGWTFLTALLIWAARRRTVLSAVLGAASFIALTIGYAAVSTARGFPDNTLPWSVIGLVVGPFVGIAATWLHDAGLRVAMAAGLLAGVGIGDGIYGLTAVAATTNPDYWILAIAVSLAVAVTAAIRARAVTPILIEAALGIVIAVLMNIVYRLL